MTFFWRFSKFWNLSYSQNTKKHDAVTLIVISRILQWIRKFLKDSEKFSILNVCLRYKSQKTHNLEEKYQRKISKKIKNVHIIVTKMFETNNYCRLSSWWCDNSTKHRSRTVEKLGPKFYLSLISDNEQRLKNLSQLYIIIVIIAN